jgi:hypothetical protein
MLLESLTEPFTRKLVWQEDSAPSVYSVRRELRTTWDQMMSNSQCEVMV